MLSCFLNSVLFAHVLYYLATYFLELFIKGKFKKRGRGRLLAPSLMLSPFAIGKINTIKLNIRDILPIFTLRFSFNVNTFNFLLNSLFFSLFRYPHQIQTKKGLSLNGAQNFKFPGFGRSKYATLLVEFYTLFYVDTN